MKLILFLEYRFAQTPDRRVWTETAYAYPFWRRYLTAFEAVQVVARLHQVPTVSDDWKQASGDHVTFVPVPHYIGPWQYLWKIWDVRHAVRNAVSGQDAVLLRVPSRLATVARPVLHKTGHPYGVEVVGDPHDVFAPGAVAHPLRPIFRWLFPRQLRKQCSEAAAAAYVTETTLQKRYPCHGYSTSVSDVELPAGAFQVVPRANEEHIASPLLITVGSLSQKYKGTHILIAALAHCVQQGLPLRLRIIGDGQHRAELEGSVETLGLQQNVQFLGQLPAGSAVREQLDQADLFVLPSLTEGLPRALLEAMARALPCIGSAVGGIPELLLAEDMVAPGQAIALANKIMEVVTNPGRMARMSARSLEHAQKYQDSILERRRQAFFQQVRQTTAAWQCKEQAA